MSNLTYQGISADGSQKLFTCDETGHLHKLPKGSKTTGQKCSCCKKKTIKNKIEALQDHLSFIEKYEGWRIYGFTLGRQQRQKKGDARLYAFRKIDGKVHSIYLGVKISSLSDAEKKISQKIKEKGLPESLIEKGVEPR